MDMIELHGVVGVDILAKDFSKALDAAKGDIILDINSGGGFVTEGIAIANQIKSYKRGKITARISFAASAMTYVALVANEVEVYDNAIFMIHNAWGVATGDYRVMEKHGVVLKAITNLLANVYVEKTKKSKAEIFAMMDDETYFYGSEIKDQGFADAVISGGETGLGREDAVAYAYLKSEEATQASKNEKFSEERIAALGLYQKEMKKTMDIKQLKAEHPEIFSAVLELGVAEERERVCAHLTLAEASGDTALAVSCIQSGEGLTASVSAKHMAASMRRRESSERASENVPNILIKQNISEDEAMARSLAKALGVEYA